MKQIVIISGKGGTGKTVITASLAALAKDKVMADCDVDAADLHLLLNPKIKEKHEFRSGKTARIDKKFCEQCGKCIVACRFSAISQDFVVDPISCEGCAFCSFICPTEAIKMQENISGEWFISDTRFGPLVHAKLGIAQENSGKLVTLVKQKAKELAEKENSDWIIVDGAPGIGCPVIVVGIGLAGAAAGGEHEAEVPAGAATGDTEAIGIDAVLVGVVADEAHGAIDVFDNLHDRRLGLREVGGRQHRVTAPQQGGHHPGVEAVGA